MFFKNIILHSNRMFHSNISFSTSTVADIFSLLFLSLSLFAKQQLEGDLETLAIVTYSSLSVSMAALLLTVVVLSCLRGLKSNTRSIHSNMAAATLLSHLTYLLGINQTEQQVREERCLCVSESKRGLPRQTKKVWVGLKTKTLSVESPWSAKIGVQNKRNRYSTYINKH